jgi:ubiquinone/menaquinone biosynthesis C-methylase UbiE
MELLERLLPDPPAALLDVGGGPGAYAAPLSAQGYSVQLVDILTLHTHQAREQSLKSADARYGVVQADAGELPFRAASQDAVLLMGPLYHLTDRQDRLRALAEAHRVLRRRGLVIATAVSRFASLLDGLYEGWLREPAYKLIVEQDLLNGQHRNPHPVQSPEHFTTAYFHTPDDFISDLENGQFSGIEIFAIEGPGWPLQSRWQIDSLSHDEILYAVRQVETERPLMGFSHHMMAVGSKP